jgi:glycosyltransferase involved in cell wall biosynthesis
MSVIQLYHVLPTMFPYGAYSMLYELHYAINKYHGHEVHQSVSHLKPTESGKIPAYFKLNSEFTTLEDLSSRIKSGKGQPVVLFHKLWGSNCDPVAKITKNKTPFLILNHTQGSNKKNIVRADRVIAVSEYMKIWMQTAFKGQKTVFIRNGVNQCRYEISKHQLANLDREKYFVTGRLNNFNDCKHPRDWVQFCGGIRLHKSHWHDYLGGGRYLSDSKSLVKKYQKNFKGNIINLTGRIDDFDTKVAHIHRWDAFLYEVPGIEGTSMSLLESLACGIPAIINNKPGNNEIIRPDTNGFVYRSRKEAVAYLQSISKNDKMLKKLKASTKQDFADRLDARHTAKAYVNLFREVSK